MLPTSSGFSQWFASSVLVNDGLQLVTGADHPQTLQNAIPPGWASAGALTDTAARDHVTDPGNSGQVPIYGAAKTPPIDTSEGTWWQNALGIGPGSANATNPNTGVTAPYIPLAIAIIVGIILIAVAAVSITKSNGKLFETPEVGK